MKNKKIKSKCNHNWEYYSGMDEIEYGIVFVYFICSKCGAMKKIKRGKVI